MSFKPKQQVSVMLSKEFCVLLGPSSVDGLHYSLHRSTPGERAAPHCPVCDAGAQSKISLNCLTSNLWDQNRKVFKVW